MERTGKQFNPTMFYIKMTSILLSCNFLGWHKKAKNYCPFRKNSNQYFEYFIHNLPVETL